MKKLHLEDKNLEYIEENEQKFKFYGELTSDNINLLKKLNIEYLDLSDLENSVFFNSCFTEFNSLISIILPRNLKSLTKECFYRCENLEEMDASNCLELNLIDKKCFSHCYSLKNIKLPNSVNTIESFAFNFCLNLESIILPKSLKIIGEHAFSTCRSLKSIEMSDSITSIGVEAFGSCNNLKTMKLPEKLKKIESNMFLYCSSLISIYIPESIKKIEREVFRGCESLNEIIIADKNINFCVEQKILFNRDKTILYLYFSKENDEYSIPNSVNTIKSCAFYGSCLKSIIIPQSVFTIEESSFCYQGCLTSFIFKQNKVLEESFSCSIFLGCSLLKYIKIPNNIVELGSYAFHNCLSLETIVIPKSVINVGNDVFNNCKSLTSVEFESSINIKEIQLNAFSNCSSLKQISLPKSIQYIFSNAFDSCISLQEVYLYGDVKYIDEYAFYNCISLKSIKIEKESLQLCDENNIVEIPKFVTKLSKGVFKNCCSIEKIKLFNNSISTIAEESFFGCKSLKYMNIPDSVKRIERRAFYSCNSFTKIKIPNSVIFVSEYAFENCTSLKKVQIPESVKSIGYRLFQGCSSLRKITVDPKNNLYCDENGVLFNKSKTILIKFPKNKNVSYYCLPNTVETIEENAFNGCKFIEQITQTKEKCINGVLNIPFSLKNIYYNAFANCSNIRKVELLNNLCLTQCFENCDLLYCIKIRMKQLEMNNDFLSCLKRKFIVSTENGFIYYENVYNLDNEHELKIYGLYNENIYFKKDLIVPFCNLKDHIKHKVEFKFEYCSFYQIIFFWLF